MTRIQPRHAAVVLVMAIVMVVVMVVVLRALSRARPTTSAMARAKGKAGTWK